jgi:hypothetical protein
VVEVEYTYKRRNGKAPHSGGRVPLMPVSLKSLHAKERWGHHLGCYRDLESGRGEFNRARDG